MKKIQYEIDGLEGKVDIVQDLIYMRLSLAWLLGHWCISELDGGFKVASTKIEWTQATWNPMSGCTKISDGCKNCYAEKMAYRLQAMGTKGYENAFEVTLHPEKLDEPLQRKKPTMYFVCSMGDLFHKDVPFDYAVGVIVPL